MLSGMQSELLHNQWFGKALGLTTAFILAPKDGLLLSIAVIAAIGLGHVFDIWAARQTYEKQSTPKGSGIKAANNYMRFLFTSLGSIAKSTGVVQRSHIKFVEQLIENLSLDAAGRKLAILWFEEGRDNPLHALHLAKYCRRENKQGAKFKNFCVKTMCELAAIDPSDAALDTTVKLATQIDIPAANVASLFGEALHKSKAQPKLNKGPRPSAGPKGNANKQPETAKPKLDPALSKAFQTMGIAPDASKSQVKKAYRRLVSKHHPDKLGRNADAKAHTQAAKKMIELRQALELIQAS